MGYDVAVITKIKIPSKTGEASDVHFIVDRGFCTMILEAKNHPNPVLKDLEKSLNMDLSFLELIEFADQEEFDESELRDLGFNEDYINEAKISGPSGHLRIDEFLKRVNNILEAIESDPNYESRMNYDRKWWVSYFDKDFQMDLKSLNEFLTKLLSLGESEFAFRLY